MTMGKEYLTWSSVCVCLKPLRSESMASALLMPLHGALMRMPSHAYTVCVRL